MTLVIAQRQKDKLSLSSDSRLTLGTSSYFDSGIKIFNIPFRLQGPLKSLEDRDKWEFQYTYGLAITGSSMNAYTVKESIAEVLANLQYVSNTSDISIIGIGQLILKVYADVSTQLSQIVREAGLSEILLAGYCLRGGRVRFLRFYPVIKDTIQYRFEEILPEDGLAFFGSGRKLGEKIYESDKTLTPLQIIKKAIESKEELTVGGVPEHGFFHKDNFKVSGISDEVIDKESGKSTRVEYLRGIGFQQDFKKMEPPMLFMSYGYTPVTPLPPPPPPEKRGE